MKNVKHFKNVLPLFVCFVLIAAMALTASGCGKKATADNTSQITASKTVTDVGTGKTKFPLTLTYEDGTEEYFTVHTDKSTVGEALLDFGFMQGEQQDYGIMITAINGHPVDFDAKGTYWAFYVDGKYANAGADSTPIEAGKDYAFKIEK